MWVKRADGRVDQKLNSYCRKCSALKVAQYQRNRYHTDPDYKARRNRQTVERYKLRHATDPDYVKALSERRRLRLREKKQAQAALSRPCANCGTDISEQRPLTRYCPDCKLAKRYAAVRKYVESHRKSKTLTRRVNG